MQTKLKRSDPNYAKVWESENKERRAKAKQAWYCKNKEAIRVMKKYGLDSLEDARKVIRIANTNKKLMANL